jgi:Zn-dependent membrane protease YugP
MYNNISDVGIKRIGGNLGDNFDPRENIIFLSEPVFSNSSVSAAGVAAHEAGHAVQYAEGYVPIKLRQFLVPITQFCSQLYMPLFFIGLLVPFMLNLGIILFSIAVVFQLVTLPVEIDASRRALRTLKSTKMLNADELEGVKKVLWAAALTYVAATFTAVVSLLRLILITRRRD